MCSSDLGVDVDPQGLITRRRLEGPPPSAAADTPKAREIEAGRGGDAPGPGFSRDFASLEEFLSFSLEGVARSEAPLSLASDDLSAREADLVAREAAVRANEEMQLAKDMVLMGREVKVSEQEKALARLADLEENDHIQASTIRELQIGRAHV